MARKGRMGAAPRRGRGTTIFFSRRVVLQDGSVLHIEVAGILEVLVDHVVEAHYATTDSGLQDDAGDSQRDVPRAPDGALGSPEATASKETSSVEDDGTAQPSLPFPPSPQ